MMVDHSHFLVHIKPWNVGKERVRMEKIDRMATQIMAEEAMKIISEAYEVVFQGEWSKNKIGNEENEVPQKVQDEERHVERRREDTAY